MLEIKNEIILGPAKVLDLPDVIQKVKGDMLELHCKTQGYPEPKITWIIGKKVLFSVILNLVQ